MGIIQKIQRFHGPALFQLIRAVDARDKSLLIKKGITKHSYLLGLPTDTTLDHSQKVGLYIKYTEKPRSPWHYSVDKDEQHEIELLQEQCKDTFILLVNGEDGITCLTYANLKQILDDNFEDSERITVRRRVGTPYRVTGQDGKLNRTVARKSFPKMVVDRLVQDS